MSATMLAEETRATEIHRLQTLIGDNRLDAVQAIGFALDAIDHYDPVAHDKDDAGSKRTTKQILWCINTKHLMHIKMMGVAVKAFDILRAERFPAR